MTRLVPLSLAIALAPAFAEPSVPSIFTLENGLQVAVLDWPGSPVVNVHVYYPVGPVVEPPGQDGIAHLYEHLMFASSTGYADGGLHRALDLSTCYANADTGPMRTSYRSVCIPALLPAVLRIEADRMAHLDPREEEFERERRIVLEELAWRGHYSPQRDLVNEVFRAGFPDHPLGRRISGTGETLEALSLDDIRAFGQQNYGPTGAVLVVSGDVDVEETRRLIEQTFAPLPRSASARAAVPPRPPPTGQLVTLDRHDLHGMFATVGVRLPQATAESRVQALLLRELLDHDYARAMLWSLPDEAVLFLSIKRRYRTVDWYGNERPVDAEDDARIARRRIWEFVGERIDSVLTDSRFEEFVKTAVRRLKEEQQDPRDRAEWIGVRLLHDQDWDWIDSIDEHAATITLEEMRKYATTNFQADQTVFGVSHGIDSGRNVDLSEPTDMAEESETGSVDVTLVDEDELAAVLALYRKHSFGGIETRTLRKGTPIHVVALPGCRGATVGGVRTFPVLDREKRGKKRGVCWAYDWLVEDWDDDDRRGPDDPLVDVSVGATPSEFHFSAEDHGGDLGAAAAEVAELLDRERLDAKRWSKLHRSVESATTSMARRSQLRAKKARWAALMDPDGPELGHLVPSPDEATRITYKDLNDLHKTLREMKGTQLYVLASPSALDWDVLERRFGDRKFKKPPRSKPIRVRLDAVHGEVVPDFEKKDVEIAVTFAPTLVDVERADAWAAFVLFESAARKRLRRRLRTERGLVYYAFVVPDWVSGCIVPEIVTGARTEDATEVLDLLVHEVRSIATEGFDDLEVNVARLEFLKSRARWATEPARARSDLRQMLRFGPPPLDPVADVLAVPLERVNELVRSWMNPDRFAFTVRGPLFEEDISRFSF